jgi:RecJ-like exonuclease
MSENEKCPYCCGTGEITIDNECGQGFDFMCPSCGGSGKKFEGNMIDCPFCIKGEVELQNTENMEYRGFICPACHSTGYIDAEIVKHWEEEG